MVRHKDSGYTIIEMEPFMRAIGSTIFRVDRESNPGQTGVAMRGSISWGRNTGRAPMSGRMAATTLDPGRITIYTDMETIFGVMAEPTKDSGALIRCTGMEYMFGKMGGVMKESTTTTRSMDLESTNGLMVAVLRGTG